MERGCQCHLGLTRSPSRGLVNCSWGPVGSRGCAPIRSMKVAAVGDGGDGSGGGARGCDSGGGRARDAGAAEDCEGGAGGGAAARWRARWAPVPPRAPKIASSSGVSAQPVRSRLETPAFSGRPAPGAAGCSPARGSNCPGAARQERWRPARDNPGSGEGRMGFG